MWLAILKMVLIGAVFGALVGMSSQCLYLKSTHHKEMSKLCNKAFPPAEQNSKVVWDTGKKKCVVIQHAEKEINWNK